MPSECRNPKCGKPLTRRSNETWAHFRVREFCNHHCYSVFRMYRDTPEYLHGKICRGCKQKYFCKNMNNYYARTTFRKGSFCSVACINLKHGRRRRPKQNAMAESIKAYLMNNGQGQW